MAKNSSRNHHKTPVSRLVPEASITRLSLYVRELSRLSSQRIGFVSSRLLAKQLGLTDAQVRRDLSYFGQFGTSGRGYEVHRLYDKLTAILGVADRTWNVALAGAGNLGSALLAYRGFSERGFVFRVVVDTDPQKVGRQVQGITIASARQLSELVKKRQVHIGLIAVPVEAAQAACDQMVLGGVRAILNFAPVHLDVPPQVSVRVVDLATELESLAYYLARSQAEAAS